MHRIDTSTATPDHKFTEGDPAVPVAATTVSAAWLNAVQEELVAVITGAGLGLEKSDNGQLWQAISQLITNAKPGLATKANPGLVQVGGGLDVTAKGLLSVLTATPAQNGIMRPDGTTCTVKDGVLKVLQQTSDYMEEWRKSWIGVPRYWRSTTLPANHCWANGDAILFADWPELKAVYDAGGFEGMLLPWDASSEQQAANLGKWRPNALNPTGLYTPALSGQFFRNWGPGEENGAGAHVLDTMRVITGQIYTYGNSGSNSGALAFNQSTTAIQGGSTSYGGTLQLNSSNLGERYSGGETAPQHVWQPLCLYLGRPS
ncbi:hypothetical protein [Desulfovibrio piger]|uniref:hypothetical protein n=1 Tax=Desulfovibrio piger TaxID=901 RepID=UPI001D54AAC1|nr:hypothetical protein [Desulfovibrio piger]HJG34105.1 hypothetical protein [Desulfovibrio piger]